MSQAALPVQLTAAAGLRRSWTAGAAGWRAACGRRTCRTPRARWSRSGRARWSTTPTTASSPLSGAPGAPCARPPRGGLSAWSGWRCAEHCCEVIRVTSANGPGGAARSGAVRLWHGPEAYCQRLANSNLVISGSHPCRSRRLWAGAAGGLCRLSAWAALHACGTCLVLSQSQARCAARERRTLTRCQDVAATRPDGSKSSSAVPRAGRQPWNLAGGGPPVLTDAWAGGAAQPAGRPAALVQVPGLLQVQTAGAARPGAVGERAVRARPARPRPPRHTVIKFARIKFVLVCSVGEDTGSARLPRVRQQACTAFRKGLSTKGLSGSPESCGSA